MRGEAAPAASVPAAAAALSPAAASTPGPAPAAVPEPCGGASRGPAVATCSGCTSPRWRDGPPLGAYSSTGTRYGETGRAVNSIAPEAVLRRSRWCSQSVSSRRGWSVRSW